MLKRTLAKTLCKLPILGEVLQSQRHAWVNRGFPTQFSGKYAPILNNILTSGYHVLPNYFSAEQCDACVAAFKHIAAHYPQHTKTREDTRIFGAEHMAAQSMTFYQDAYLQELADGYYGEKSLIGTMLANRLQPKEGHHLGSGGDWHRDSLQRQFKALVYLTDVTADNGAFQVISGSAAAHHQQYRDDMRVMGATYDQNRLSHAMLEPLIAADPQRLVTFTGGKGTVVLVDTSSIHRGAPLLCGERFAMFNYYYRARGFDVEMYRKKFSPSLPVDFAHAA